MKKLFITFNLLVLILLISSCGDILTPEPDTHTTKIKYHFVLKDQEHSVIMPLKVGNIWIYKQTELNGDGSVKAITYDTTIVKKDTIIKGEQWFLVDDPSQSEELFFFTNTNVGLNIACTLCSNNKLLRAEYPAKYNRYLLQSDEFPTQIRLYNEQGELTDQPIVFVSALIWVNVDIIDGYNSYYGIYKTFKYNNWCDLSYIIDGNKKYGPLPQGQYYEYFVPNLGLVHKEFYKILSDSSKSLSKTWDLIHTNVKI